MSQTVLAIVVLGFAIKFHPLFSLFLVLDTFLLLIFLLMVPNDYFSLL